MTHRGTKRSGAIAAVYTCERQGQPSDRTFAGSLLINWEGAGP